ncbi:MAG: short-chain fatty acyl-CoA regulator family protein [Pseudomonadota bacterium]
MARDALTGGRIRDRRIIIVMKHADLARQAGIIASYLNLIEHNRRRIGGKLLLDIASVLEVEASALTEGAEAALIATLREAGEAVQLNPDEAERAEDLAGRFPGWAAALVTAHRRIAGLERTVETLSDRLSQDPQLAASVHEVLSMAAAIRSTASILADDKDLPTEWRDRFHVNIDQDSRRLADSSKALAQYLEAAGDESDAASSPLEEVENFLASYDYNFPILENGQGHVDDLVRDPPHLGSVASRHIARGVLERIVSDSAVIALPDLQAAIAEMGVDPIAISRAFNAPVALVLRRLAALPDLQTGLVVSDRSGSLIFRKPVSGFDIPRYGASCPLWPLFQALCAPGQILSKKVVHVGRNMANFQCFAIADQVGNGNYNQAPLLHATMLILPLTGADVPASEDTLRVGSTCRVCSSAKCAGRREPSILSEGV